MRRLLSSTNLSAQRSPSRASADQMASDRRAGNRKRPRWLVARCVSSDRVRPLPIGSLAVPVDH
jgi:hypothetical protein